MGAQVLVVGGGPAGLAAAIAAAQAGFEVEVAEPCFPASSTGSASPEPVGSPAGIDKCCGEGLLPPAIDALGQLGITRSTLEGAGHLLYGICFHDGNCCTSALFPLAAGVGVGLRRTALHALLAARAQAVGVRLTAKSARFISDGEGPRVLLGNDERRPRWVIGADGAQSATRSSGGLDAGRMRSRRFALRQHFQLPPGRQSPSSVQVYWTRGAQAYVTPVGGGRVGVAILAAGRPVGLAAEKPSGVAEGKLKGMAAALARFPALACWLAGAEPCSTPRGAVTTHRTLPGVQSGSLALVGDASGSVDAVTGDGLSLAFLQAVALGRALGAGDLHQYEREHRCLMRPARLMSRALLAMGAHPLLTSSSMSLLSHAPGLFPALLRLHTQALHFPTPTLKESSPWPPPAPISTRSTM